MSDFKSKLGVNYRIDEIAQDEPLSSQFSCFLRKGVYGLWDKTACIFSSHFICNNDIAAQRSFVDCMGQDTGVIAGYFRDFALYKLAEIDERGNLKSFDDEQMLLDGTVAWEMYQDKEQFRQQSQDKFAKKLKVLHDDDIRKSKLNAAKANPNAANASGAAS
ncbi:nonstructural protein [Chicken microvirus mg8_109]|nr:nonstructural protein [Chicken microvirus mg8_109]